MLYYSQEESLKRGRRVGAIAAAAYFVVVAMLMILVSFKLSRPDTMGEGILINFGNVDEASSGGDLAVNDEIAEIPQQQQQSTPSDSEIVTQDFEDAPEVPLQSDTDRPPVETTPAEQPRQVNQRTLFPGRTAGSTQTSDGTGQGTGNQGNLAGSPDGSHDGTGLGDSAGSANLSGRSLVGNLPRPDYAVREEGRVVINITVDQSGNVTAAEYRSLGSTTQNTTLVGAALRAARQAKFNVDENALVSQSGTITYNFRMR